MANVKTTPEEWATAEKMFQAGYQYPDIAAKISASVPSICKRAKREGWKRKSDVPGLPPAPEKDEEKARQVEVLAGCGIADEEIATIMEVPVAKLREDYRQELVKAGPRMVAKVALSLYKMATNEGKPNVHAIKYWLEQRGGWGNPDNGKMGKKEERQEAAKRAGAGKFGQTAPPKIVPIRGGR